MSDLEARFEELRARVALQFANEPRVTIEPVVRRRQGWFEFDVRVDGDVVIDFTLFYSSGKILVYDRCGQFAAVHKREVGWLR